jgi:hypothetical protein
MIATGKIKARRHSATRIMIDAQSVRDCFNGLPLVGEPAAPAPVVRTKRYGARKAAAWARTRQ